MGRIFNTMRVAALAVLGAMFGQFAPATTFAQAQAQQTQQDRQALPTLRARAADIQRVIAGGFESSRGQAAGIPWPGRTLARARRGAGARFSSSAKV